MAATIAKAPAPAKVLRVEAPPVEAAVLLVADAEPEVVLEAEPLLDPEEEAELEDELPLEVLVVMELDPLDMEEARRTHMLVFEQWTLWCGRTYWSFPSRSMG